MAERDIYNSEEALIISGEENSNKYLEELHERAASAEILDEEDFQPDTTVTIVIPESVFWNQEVDEIQTEFRFLEGDFGPVITTSPFAAIRFELKNLKNIVRIILKRWPVKGAAFL